MKYISVGYVHKKGYEFSMEIAHAGFVFPITGALADLWLRGSTGFSSAESRWSGRASSSWNEWVWWSGRMAPLRRSIEPSLAAPLSR